MCTSHSSVAISPLQGQEFKEYSSEENLLKVHQRLPALKYHFQNLILKNELAKDQVLKNTQQGFIL